MPNPSTYVFGNTIKNYWYEYDYKENCHLQNYFIDFNYLSLARHNNIQLIGGNKRYQVSKCIRVY